jgi:hypothetical protein
MTCSDENCDRSRRLGAEDMGWSHRSSTKWSDDRVTPCVVYTVHVETMSVGFFVEPQN